MEENIVSIFGMKHRKSDAIRRALLLATGDYLKQDLAKMMGISRQRFSAFLGGAQIGDEYCEIAETWLKEKGYWERAIPELAAPVSGQPTAMTIMVDRLRLLADFLSSPDFSTDEKVEEFVGFVERAHAALDSYRAALKKSDE